MPESFSFVLPDLIFLPDTQTNIKSAFLSSKHTSFITILHQFIESAHPSLLSTSDRTAIQATLKDIWKKSDTVNSSVSLSVSIYNQYKSLLQKPSLVSALMKAIIAARFHTIKMQSKIKLETQAEQFQNLKETHQRLNFIRSIFSILTPPLSSQDMNTEFHHFIISAVSDAYHISYNIANGLFSEHFTNNIEDLKQCWQESTSTANLLVMNAKLLFVIYKKEATLCLADINTYAIRGLLCGAKYYFSIEKPDLAKEQLKLIDIPADSTKLDEWVLSQLTNELKPHITELLAQVNAKEKKLKNIIDTPKSTNKPFTLVFPDSPPLVDSGKKMEASLVDNSPTSFFDILNQLIYEHYHSLLEPSNYSFMHDRIKNIWDSNSPIPLPFVLSELPCEQNYLHDLIPLIVKARFQAIEHHKKMNFSAQENIFQYIKEVYKRIKFISNIGSILPLVSFSKNTPSQRCDFFTALFSDIVNNLQNISEGLFQKYFTENFNDLKNYWKIIQNIGDSLAKKLIEEINIIDNVDSIINMWECAISAAICLPKYHFALGEDNTALTYSSINPFEDTSYLKNKPELAKQLEKVVQNHTDRFEKLFLKQFGQLLITISNDTQRKMYIELRACFKEQNEKGEINTRPNTLKTSLENILKENLEQLKQYTEVNNKNFDLIRDSILSLGLAYEQNYNKNINNAGLCHQIITHLYRILEDTKGSIIAFDINEHLTHHKVKISKFSSSKPDTDLKLPPNEDITPCVKTEPVFQNNELKQAQARLKALKAQKMSLEQTHTQLQQTHTQATTKQTQDLEAIKVKVEALKAEQLCLQKAKSLNDTQQNKNKQQKQNVTKNILHLQHFNDLSDQSIEKSKKTLESLENKLNKLKKQHEALCQTSVEAQKQKAVQLEKEKAYQQTIQKLKLENEVSQKQQQVNEQNAATLELELQKATITATSLQTAKQTSVEEHQAEICQLQRTVQQLNSYIRPFQEQHAALLDAYSRVSDTLKKEYEHVPAVDSVNHELDGNWNKNLEGFYNVFNTLIGDFQSQCQQMPHPMPQHMAPVVYASRPISYIPSRQVAYPPVNSAPQVSRSGVNFTKVVDFSSGTPKPSNG